MALTKDQLIDEIKGMSVLDLAELVKALEEEFGVSAAAAPVMVAGPGGGGGGDGAAAAEEKTEFDVVLNAAGDKKIQVIKVVREATGLGLAEAKAFVDAPGKPVKQGLSKEDADKLKKAVTEAGGTVEVV